MALAAALKVDELSDQVVVTLGEQFAPLSAFSVNALENQQWIGTNQVQVEKSGTAPSNAGGDDKVDYEVDSGTNLAQAVTMVEISRQQEITSVEQIGGHQFLTAVPELVKAVGAAIWDDITAVILTGTFGAAVPTHTAGALSLANLGTMWAAVDSPIVNLLIERNEADVLQPSDKNSFQMGEQGAYGFNKIYAVSNFVGATADTTAFACAPSAIITVAGAPQRAPQVAEAYAVREIVEVPGLNTTAEYRIWANTKTGSLWMGLAIVFGAAAGDAAAGTLAIHA